MIHGISKQQPGEEQNYHGNVRHDVLQFLTGKHRKVLDVGGGSGATASWLKTQGMVEIADVVDGFDGPVENNIDKHSRFDLNDSVALAEYLRENGPYDLILALDVLEHLYDPWTVAANLHDGLTNDGLFLSSIPNIRHYTVMRELFLKGDFAYRDFGLLDRTHIRFFVRKTATELMEQAGFAVEKFERIVLQRKKIGMLNRLLGNRLRDFVTLQYVIFARKGASKRE